MNDKVYLSPDEAQQAFHEYQQWAERAAAMILMMRNIDGLNPRIIAHLDAIIADKPTLETRH